MSDENNASNKIWITSLIAVPIVLLLLYFLVPIFLVYPVIMIYSSNTSIEIIEAALAPVIYLADNFDSYNAYIEWQVDVCNL